MSCCTSRVPSISGSSRCCSAERVGADCADVVLVDREDEIEGGNLLLDEAPFVHPPGALEQQRLGTDADQEILALGPHAGLEVEGPRGPGEQVVHGLLDLDPHVVFQLGAGQRAQPDEDLAQLVLPVVLLRRNRLLELLRRDPALSGSAGRPVDPAG